MNNTSDKYGILLLNMGGPESLDDVEEYIFNLLADPLMIRLPLGTLMQKPLARLIAKKRSPKVVKRYELIGGKSPITEATALQANELSTATGLPAAFAMRYTAPTVNEAVNKLSAAGCNRLVLVPLYPQYSTVSTLSSIRDFERRFDGNLEYKIIDRHFNHPGYIAAMRHLLFETISRADSNYRTHILFAAHSIPESYIRAGDPYADEVEETARQICDTPEFAYTYSLAYQSRVGPVKWRGPTLEEELDTLLSQGVEQLIVQPLSFVTENLETLFDLDIDFRETCNRKNVGAMSRVPTPGHMKLYIDALASMINGEIQTWEEGDA